MNINYYLKTLTYVGIALVLLKVLSPYIIDFIQNYLSGKKKEAMSDIDRLIAKRKREFAIGNPYQDNKNSPETKSTTKPKNKTVERYQKKKKKLDNSETTKIQNLEEVLNFLDELSWGDSQIFQEIQKDIKNKTGFSVDYLLISKEANNIIKSDELSIFSENLPNILTIQEIIKIKVFCSIIVLEINSKNFDLIENISKRYGATTSSLSKSFQLVTKLAIDPKNKISKSDFTGKEIISLKGDNALISNGAHVHLQNKSKTNYSNLNQLLSDLKKYAFIFRDLEPIPSKVSLDQAYEIMGLSKTASVEIIKSKYKTLAKNTHPDRLAAKGLPKELTLVATENFSNLKNVYEQIMNSRKS